MSSRVPAREPSDRTPEKAGGGKPIFAYSVISVYGDGWGCDRHREDEDGGDGVYGSVGGELSSGGNGSPVSVFRNATNWFSSSIDRNSGWMRAEGLPFAIGPAPWV